MRRLLLALAPALLVVAVTVSCSRTGETGEQADVAHAFESWKNAMINHQPEQAMSYFPSHADDYLQELNTTTGGTISAASPTPSACPGVDLLLRTALEKKVPADVRSKLSLGALMQRISDRHLLKDRDVQQIALGRVSINGARASAEIYYQGSLTALRLPFLKEGNAWKIDVMALLPYVEVLMRVDRAIKGETEAEQVDQLVSKLPSL